MQDTEMKNIAIEHGHVINSLVKSIEHMADSAIIINKKMYDIISMLNSKNIFALLMLFIVDKNHFFIGAK